MSLGFPVGNILLQSGKLIRAHVHIYQGACMIGDPTAYAIVNKRRIWLKPGESVQYLEVVLPYFAAGYCYEQYSDAGCVEVCTIG